MTNKLIIEKTSTEVRFAFIESNGDIIELVAVNRKNFNKKNTEIALDYVTNKSLIVIDELIVKNFGKGATEGFVKLTSKYMKKD